MTPAKPARIHLLPAKESPRVVVIRRKPSKWFHILLWDTERDELASGSWFNGKLYWENCDLSFDGHWMAYFAMGARAQTWTAVCRPPWLKAVAEIECHGANGGGGYWRDAGTLMVNRWCGEGERLWSIVAEPLPFRCEPSPREVLAACVARLERDGWKRAGPNLGEDRRRPSKKYMGDRVGDDGWTFQPTPVHPVLRTRYAGYLEHGHTFRFSLDGHPELIDNQVDWACYDALGALVFSRLGVIARCARPDLIEGRVTRSFDLEPLEPGQLWQDRADASQA